MSLDDFFERCCLQLPAQIGRKSVARFLGPEPIDFRINRIETAEDILYKLNSLFRRKLAGLLAQSLGFDIHLSRSCTLPSF